MLRTSNWHGHTLYWLENDQLEAALCPGLGNNLIRLFDKKAGREVLRAPADPQTLIDAPIHYGTPILMPPNRIRGGVFRFDGREYRFPINNPAGYHIHGFHRSQPWKVVAAETRDDISAVTAEWSTRDFPDVMAMYPHPLTVTATYALSGTTLELAVTVRNEGELPAPFGFGLHTWFMIDGEPGEWTLTLPSEHIWELDEFNMPTGRLLPLTPYEALNSGLNLRDVNMDTVFQIGGRPRAARLSKPGYTLKYEASDAFRQWVVYTKGVADQFICLEPYTWVTNAPNLELEPEVTGVRAIEPGALLPLIVTLTVERD